MFHMGVKRGAERLSTRITCALDLGSRGPAATLRAADAQTGFLVNQLVSCRNLE